MKRIACAVTVVLALAIGDACWGVCVVNIPALGNLPTPPNPVRVLGRVTNDSPVMLSDGGGTITVSGLTAEVGDFLAVTGDWDGSTLTASGPTEGFIGPAGTQMVYISAGSFLMGNNGSEPHSLSDELPQHSVSVSGYWIGKYEVTRGEFRQFMNAGGYSDPACWSTDGWNWKGSRTEPQYWAEQQEWGTGAFIQTDRHPVVGVSYYEAEAFCKWAGGRLPTEAEWEKAARWTGSYPNVHPWGNVWETEKCNNYYDTNSLAGGYQKQQTAPVGSYSTGTSPYGCHDMMGNVWEWCRDWYLSDYYSQTPNGGWVDPQGPASGSYRVLRGGSWTDDHPYLRCSFRYSSAPESAWSNYGFRLAR